MKIFTYQTGALGVNTYVLVASGGDAVAIDVGGSVDKLLGEEKKQGFKIKAVLLTHGHFDHIGGVKFFQGRGAKVYIGENEKDFTRNKSLNLSTFFCENIEGFDADYFVKDGEVLNVLDFTFKVISTSGHTKGGVCYAIDNYLFTGDTLFERSYGRVDFPTGNLDELIDSINKLFKLQGDYVVYPGHGESTTLDEERNYNPINNYM